MLIHNPCIFARLNIFLYPNLDVFVSAKKQTATKEQFNQKKKEELEKRLEDVSSKLGTSKKPNKGRQYLFMVFCVMSLPFSFLFYSKILLIDHRLQKVVACGIFPHAPFGENSEAVHSAGDMRRPMGSCQQRPPV